MDALTVSSAVTAAWMVSIRRMEDWRADVVAWTDDRYSEY
jgi:hypothetical protein